MPAAPTTHRIAFEAIGTHWEIDLFGADDPTKVSKLEQRLKNRIEVFDMTYSRFRDDATVQKLARSPGRITLPADAQPLLALYKRLYTVTEGSITPLVGTLLTDAGYDTDYRLTPKSTLLPAPKWEHTLKYEHPFLTATQPVTLDFGAAGKGYLVDIVGGLLQAGGVGSFLINAGGDILHRGGPNDSLRIGLEHPLDPTEAIGIVKLGRESICGSASNRRKWGTMHHIFDPLSAEPVRDVIATWAVAKSALLADGLATALFTTAAVTLRKHFRFEYVVVYSDMSICSSDGLQAEFFRGEHA